MLAPPLPGPKTAVFGCEAPCAPTQKSPYRTDLLWETLRALNRPGRGRTVPQGGGRGEAPLLPQAQYYLGAGGLAPRLNEDDTVILTGSDSNDGKITLEIPKQ